MKKQDLKEKSKEDMIAMLAQKREELRTLRFSTMGGRIKDASAPKKTRVEIARIMTEMGVRAKNA